MRPGPPDPPLGLVDSRASPPQTRDFASWGNHRPPTPQARAPGGSDWGRLRRLCPSPGGWRIRLAPPQPPGSWGGAMSCRPCPLGAGRGPWGVRRSALPARTSSRKRLIVSGGAAKQKLRLSTKTWLTRKGRRLALGRSPSSEAGGVSRDAPRWPQGGSSAAKASGVTGELDKAARPEAEGSERPSP